MESQIDFLSRVGPVKNGSNPALAHFGPKGKKQFFDVGPQDV